MCIRFFVYLAPQEVSQMMVDVISDSSIQVQWGPPTRANGILTHYTVAIFNQETGFDFSVQVNSSAAEVLTIPGLRMLIFNVAPTISIDYTLFIQDPLFLILYKCLHQQRLEKAVLSHLSFTPGMEVKYYHIYT